MSHGDDTRALHPTLTRIAREHVPRDFMQLWVRADFPESDASVYSVALYYQANDGGFHAVYEGINGVTKAVLALHEAARSTGKPPFTSATLRVDRDGATAADYGYDPILNFEDGTGREDAWIAQHLGRDKSLIYDEAPPRRAGGWRRWLGIG